MKFPSLQKLNKQKIALLGFGLDNQALLKLLTQQKISAEIVIKDASRDPKNFNQGLDDFDLLVRSPGWPLHDPQLQKALANKRTTLTSPLNLFFELCPSKNIIGITGTKGKGTTATLIYQLLKQSGQRVWLGGNIGVSPLSFLTKIKPEDYLVLELSSFQLEDLRFSPKFAVITNLFPEHLAPADPKNPNYHLSLTSYWQAKLNIAKQKTNHYLIANPQLASRLKNRKLPGKLIYFSPATIPSQLVGDYNRENIGAALAVAKLLKLNIKTTKQTIANFKNLEHRLELVATRNGVKYFDNSFSTTPESTRLDLLSFSEPIIQIAGGADKGADFSKLAKTITQEVKHLILLPGLGSDKLKVALKLAGFPAEKISFAKEMSAAVALAKQIATRGDVVLLSTACASFGIFKNYKERGDLFKTYVKQKN